VDYFQLVTKSYSEELTCPHCKKSNEVAEEQEMIEDMLQSGIFELHCVGCGEIFDWIPPNMHVDADVSSMEPSAYCGRFINFMTKRVLDLGDLVEHTPQMVDLYTESQVVTQFEILRLQMKLPESVLKYKVEKKRLLLRQAAMQGNLSGPPPYNPDHTTHQVGDTVEGNYMCLGTWYPARVLMVYGDGTCDIQYVDGTIERMEGKHLRAVCTLDEMQPQNIPPASTPSQHLRPAGSQYLQPAGSQYLQPAGSQHNQPAPCSRASSFQQRA